MRQIGYGARNPQRRPGRERDDMSIWRGYLCHEIERAQHPHLAEDAEQRVYDLARQMARLARRRYAV